MDQSTLFLDHHSTTPVDPEVLNEMLPFFRELFGNAQSQNHAWGWRAQRAMDGARQHLTMALGCSDPKEIIFTSGATESLFTAIFGWFLAHRDSSPLMACSAIEHKSSRAAFEKVRKLGGRVEEVPVDRQGHLEIDHLQLLCERGLKFFSLIHGHNEIGTVQKLDLILPLLKAHDVCVHLDLSQSVGKVPLVLDDLPIDLASFAGHKFGAPQGVGGLYVNLRKKPVFEAPFSDGVNPRLGTPPVALIVGLGKAAQVAHTHLISQRTRWLELRETLWAGLKALDAQIILNGCPEMRLPNNLNVTLPGLLPHKLSSLASRLAVSTSSACTTDSVESQSLKQLGVPTDLQRKTLRFGLGRDTSLDTIHEALDLLKPLFEAPGGR